jgi:HAD superfamily hydrolase (TIGR01490 family)
LVRTAAIFDLDGTLLDDASGRLFTRYLRSEGKLREFVRRRDMPILASVIAAYQLGLLSATRAAQYTARVVAGLQVDYFWQTVRAWFDEMLVHHITDGGREVVAWHSEQGHTMLICSASSQFSVRPVAEHLSIPHYISSEWLSADGRLTGGVRLPIAYGEGKVLYVRQWAERFGIDLERSYFYTDHISDLPLLELVGNPVAVAPDRNLFKLSTERGWRVDRW